MTSWTHHHPPHDHPNFDAYLNTLTEDDLAAINTTQTTSHPDPNDPRHSQPQHETDN
jgi:hypothetical protein